MDLTYGLIQVAVMAAATLLARGLPFLVFPSGKKLPKIIDYLGKVLPDAVIAMLVIYCLKDVSVTTRPYGLPELFAFAATAGMHLWRKNSILSMAVGTAVYMILIRII